MNLFRSILFRYDLQVCSIGALLGIIVLGLLVTVIQIDLDPLALGSACQLNLDLLLLEYLVLIFDELEEHLVLILALSLKDHGTKYII